MSQPFWMARTGSALDGGFLTYSQTAQEDAPYVLHDLAGSIAHVLGLGHVGLLHEEETGQLVGALQELARAWEQGTWSLDPSLEDVHMNIEAHLTHALEDTGRKVHTGRSRNDQVATCITLFAREGLVSTQHGLQALIQALLLQAEANVDTPWIARTHGQDAQPATLGFLLAAHAARFQDVQLQLQQTFQALDESPLGAGAVAGSTLPLDPAFTAQQLGLKPLRSALLCAGARDPVLRTTQVLANLGQAMASLAQDLLDLFSDKLLHLPSGLTSGSSLMPQKRNPDALELVRGRAKALQGPYQQALALTQGLGLGYMRDLQATKPPLTASVVEAQSTLAVLVACVSGASFPVDKLSALLDNTAIVGTDLAEALVQHGVPFRSAYQVVAGLYAAQEQGTPLAEALKELQLPEASYEACAAVLTANPHRRNTRGGPSAAAVTETLGLLQQTFQEQEQTFQEQAQATTIPVSLLAGHVEVQA